MEYNIKTLSMEYCKSLENKTFEVKSPKVPIINTLAYNDLEYLSAIYKVIDDYKNIDDFTKYEKFLKGE